MKRLHINSRGKFYYYHYIIRFVKEQIEGAFNKGFNKN